jgi:ATP adenylyltransferase
MDYLSSPWRFRYVSGAEPARGCLFCTNALEQPERSNLVVHRASLNFVILNLYPYNTGHLMIAPYEHVGALSAASEGTLEELMRLTRTAERLLNGIYRPAGLNIGMNVGACAGAGVEGHLHMHVVPRWNGDANFMTVIGETRVSPEDLDVTYSKIRAAFDAV